MAADHFHNQPVARNVEIQKEDSTSQYLAFEPGVTELAEPTRRTDEKLTCILIEDMKRSLNSLSF